MQAIETIAFTNCSRFKLPPNTIWPDGFETWDDPSVFAASGLGISWLQRRVRHDARFHLAAAAANETSSATFLPLTTCLITINLGPMIRARTGPFFQKSRCYYPITKSLSLKKHRSERVKYIFLYGLVLYSDDQIKLATRTSELKECICTRGGKKRGGGGRWGKYETTDFPSSPKRCLN